MGGKGGDLCIDMEGSARAIEGLTAREDRPRCFEVKGSAVRYRVDLKALRRIRSDPDFATDLGPSWIFHDAAVLLHPDGLDVPMQVRFVNPPGISASAPWPQEKDGAFLVSPAQFDAGAYVVVGKLKVLPEIVFDGWSARLTLVDEKKTATDEQLREWVRGALQTLGVFYKGSPSLSRRPLHIVIAGVDSGDAGVFGSVLRRGDPSVMLLFGDHARSGFESDWVVHHELFHLGNPPTEGRFAWFTEGFTTYYAELLRARRGVRTAEQTWGNLISSAKEFCSPEGTSLRQRSDRLGRNHQWMQVYWGGACLALQLDVAIRKKSGNAKSLDDVMRALRSGPERDEAGVARALDEAAGGRMASELLEEKKQSNLDALFKELGVSLAGDDLAKFDDAAPLAKVRQSMTK